MIHKKSTQIEDQGLSTGSLVKLMSIHDTQKATESENILEFSNRASHALQKHINILYMHSKILTFRYLHLSVGWIFAIQYFNIFNICKCVVMERTIRY